MRVCEFSILFNTRPASDIMVASGNFDRYSRTAANAVGPQGILAFLHRASYRVP